MKKRKVKRPFNGAFTPPSSAIPLDTVRMILRIYWMDRTIRERAGHKQGTRGLLARVSKQFGVPDYTVKRIFKMRDRRSRAIFKKISVGRERRYVRSVLDE